ncbi:MAG: AEC family transporter [Actinobacteria bacterium]|nr:AEC family transporter [Actinomycetota bacterium]
MVSTAFAKVLQLFLLILAGFILKRSGLLNENDARKIITLNTYTFLPALIFYVIYTSDFKSDFILVPLVGLLLIFIMNLISFVVGYLSGIREKKHLMPFIVASSAGNTGYIGYPVSLALFGKQGLSLAVTFDIFATVFYALIFAALLISYGAGKTESFSELFKSVITFPPTIAAILAVLLRSVRIPLFFQDTLEFASQAAIPLTLVALGISLVQVVRIDYFKHLALSVTLKLIIAPLIAFLVVPWFLNGLPAKITILQSGMPALMLTYILSVRYQTDPEFASFIVFFSTLLSVITIPLLTLLIK